METYDYNHQKETTKQGIIHKMGFPVFQDVKKFSYHLKCISSLLFVYIIV